MKTMGKIRTARQLLIDALDKAASNGGITPVDATAAAGYIRACSALVQIANHANYAAHCCAVMAEAGQTDVAGLRQRVKTELEEALKLAYALGPHDASTTKIG